MTDWIEFTPTLMGMRHKKRTFWQWLSRKPRELIHAHDVKATYRLEGNTVHIQWKALPNNKPMPASIPQKNDQQQNARNSQGRGFNRFGQEFLDHEIREITDDTKD